MSLLLPKKYTATARILIEPPAGSDQRTFVAVSPIYLESLKTYEHLASGDSLFLGALKHFHLRAPDDGRPVEAWKRSVLKVEIPRNTRVMEVSATLPDSKQAQQLAQYLASETVRLSRDVSMRSGEDLAELAETQLREARGQLEQAQQAWSKNERDQPIQDLENRAGALVALRDEANRSLLWAEEQMAGAGGEALDSARARAHVLQERIAALDRESSHLEATLADRNARRDFLATARKDAEVAVVAAEQHLREVRAALGYTGERLSIIDPGIAPERPSSPNFWLNVIAALLLGLIASLLYSVLQAGASTQASEVRSFRVARNA